MWRRRARVADLPPEVGVGTGRIGFVVVDEVMRAEITDVRLAGGVVTFRGRGVGPAQARNGEPTQMVVYGNDLAVVASIRGPVVIPEVRDGQPFVFDVQLTAKSEGW